MSTITPTFNSATGILSVAVVDTAPAPDHWIGIYTQGSVPPAGYAEGFFWLNGTGDQNDPAVASITIDVNTSVALGNLTVHLFNTQSWTPLASANITIPAPGSTSISGAVVNGKVVITVRDVSPQVVDVIVVGSEYRYLNNTQTAPSIGIGYAQLSPFILLAGSYDITLSRGATLLASNTLVLTEDFIPEPVLPTRWMDNQELILDLFGPGASGGIVGPYNPAGPRSGTILTVETGIISGFRSGTFTARSFPAACAAARPGDDIILAPRRIKTYAGEFIFPAVNSNKDIVPGVTPMLPWRPTEPSFIRIMTEDWASLPLRRANRLDHLSNHLARFKGTNGAGSVGGQNHVWSFAAGVKGYWTEGISLESADVTAGVVVLVDEITSVASPENMVWSKCYLDGNPGGVTGSNKGAQRGFYGLGRKNAILHSTIEGFNNNATVECSGIFIQGAGHRYQVVYNTVCEAATQACMAGGQNTSETPNKDAWFERSIFRWDPKWQKDLYKITGRANISGTSITAIDTDSNSISSGVTLTWSDVPGVGWRFTRSGGVWNTNVTPGMTAWVGSTRVGEIQEASPGAGVESPTTIVVLPPPGSSPPGNPVSTWSIGADFIPQIQLGDHAFFFVPVKNLPPVQIVYPFSPNGKVATTVSAYGDSPTELCGILTEGMVDSAYRSPGVSVIITGNNTVTRSDGLPFGRQVKTNRYFYKLDSLTPARYPITSISTDRKTLTISTTPVGGGSPISNGTGILNWVVGTWNGEQTFAKYANLWETKATIRALHKYCIFEEYWFDGRQNAQEYAIAFKSNSPANPSTDITIDSCLFRKTCSMWNDFGGGAGPIGSTPILIKDTLAIVGERFPYAGVAYAKSNCAHSMVYDHCTLMMEADSVVAGMIPNTFSNTPGGPGWAWKNSVIAVGSGVFLQDINDTFGDKVDDTALDHLTIPRTNVNRNVFCGGMAVSRLRTTEQLRTNILTSGGKIFGNAAIDSRVNLGMVNPTGDEDGNYDIASPVYTTPVGALTISAATPAVLTLSGGGVFPPSIQKSTPFRLIADGVDKLTSVRSRAIDGSSVTLVDAYPTIGSGLTGVFTFQGSAADGLNPGVRNLSVKMAIWAEVIAGTISVTEGGSAPPGIFPPLKTRQVPKTNQVLKTRQIPI